MYETPDMVIYDGYGNGPVTVVPGNSSPTSANPALVVALSPNSNSVSITGDGYTVDVTGASSAATASQKALVVTMSPNNTGHIKGTIQPLYGTAGQAMTITLASLASAAARASTAVNNTVTLYEDVYVFVKITTAGTPSATGYVNIYFYGSVDGGTTYPEAITGTDAAVTLTSPPNLTLIAQINANTVATKLAGPFSVCRNAGLDRLPAYWGIVIVNNTGAAFNTTAANFAVTYQGINSQIS